MEPRIFADAVEGLRRAMEDEAPPRDDYGCSRAWQVAVTKLEEGELWLERAQKRYNEHEGAMSE